MLLPTLPAAHARALGMLARHDVDVTELGSIVESLGTTRRIVASAALNGAFANLSSSGLDADALWSSVLATALLSDAVAWAETARSEAFTAGLLHPLGRLAMAGEEPVKYRRVVAMVHDGWDTAAAEIEVFGYDSTEWGAQVASAWDLPELIVEALRDQDTGEGGGLSWVVWRGLQLSRSLGYGDGVSPPVESTFDIESADGRIVGSVGGPEGVQAQIEWYRGSLGLAA
jgi:hypothetical protein